MRPQRDGKLLPRGRRDEIIKAVGISKSELARRVKFAAMYPEPRQLSNAVREFKSWRQIISVGLRKVGAKPKAKSSVVVKAFRLSIRQAQRAGK